MVDPLHPCCAVELARIDERIKAIYVSIEARQQAHASALKIASEELARRLDLLNNEQSRIDRLHTQMVPRELFEVKQSEVLGRMSRLEGDFREQAGKLWLPLIGAAAVASGLAVTIVKWL